MFKINEDRSIYLTRGDAALIDLKVRSDGGTYIFKKGETVRFRVFERKNCSAVELIKDVVVTADTDTLQIYLSGEDTRIGSVISRPTDFWYEVEVDPNGSPQTVIGYDLDGPKIFKLFPEGDNGKEMRPVGAPSEMVGKELYGFILDPDTVHGKSAYEIALLHGFNGTEEEWIKSVRADADRAEAAAADATRAATAEVERLVDSLGITQTTGEGTMAVMSQKAVTDMMLERMPKLNILICEEYISVDTVNGVVTIPSLTELISGSFHKILDEEVTVSLLNFTSSSGNYIFYNKFNDSFEVYPNYSLTEMDKSKYYYFCSIRRGHSGYDWIPSCDLSVPYYLNGVLVGSPLNRDELYSEVGTAFCPLIPAISFSEHPFPSIDSAKKLLTFKSGTIMVDRRLKEYYGNAEIGYHTPLTCDMSVITETTAIKVYYSIASKKFVAKSWTEVVDWNDNILVLCYNTDSKTAISSMPVVVDGRLYSASESMTLNWGSASEEGTNALAATTYCPIAPPYSFESTRNPFPSIDSATKIVTFAPGTILIDHRLPYSGNAEIPYHAPTTCDMSMVTGTTAVKVYYNISSKNFVAKPWTEVVDWKDNVLVLSYNTNSKTGMASVPVVVDGKLYSASDYMEFDFGVGSGGGNTEAEDTVDNAKSKEFAELFYGSDNVEPFIFFTDPHLCQFEGDGWREEFDRYMSTLKAYYNESAVSRVFCGGDWLGGTVTNVKDACYRLGLADAKMREYFEEYHSVRGNHESNFEYSGDNDTLSRETIRNLMFRKEGKTYYTVDGDNSKFYVFDTQDEPSGLYDISYETEQKIWFAESLKNNTAENIILMAHRFYIGTVSDAALFNFTSQLLQIAQAFNNRKSITVNGITYDFTNASGKVRCLLAGHSHSDYVTESYDIPVVITTHFRDGNTPTFDMCLADYDSNKLYLVRVGTGESRTIDI